MLLSRLESHKNLEVAKNLAGIFKYVHDVQSTYFMLMSSLNFIRFKVYWHSHAISIMLQPIQCMLFNCFTREIIVWLIMHAENHMFLCRCCFSRLSCVTLMWWLTQVVSIFSRLANDTGDSSACCSEHWLELHLTYGSSGRRSRTGRLLPKGNLLNLFSTPWNLLSIFLLGCKNT